LSHVDGVIQDGNMFKQIQRKINSSLIQIELTTSDGLLIQKKVMDGKSNNEAPHNCQNHSQDQLQHKVDKEMEEEAEVRI